MSPRRGSTTCCVLTHAESFPYEIQRTRPHRHAPRRSEKGERSCVSWLVRPAATGATALLPHLSERDAGDHADRSKEPILVNRSPGRRDDRTHQARPRTGTGGGHPRELPQELMVEARGPSVVHAPS